jgi:hypothetical protein
MNNLEKERTLFVPIGKTGRSTSQQRKKLSPHVDLKSPKRIAAIPFTPEQTNNPTSSSAFTDYLSSEDVPRESPQSPPTEMLSPELPTATVPPSVPDAHQTKLSTKILSPLPQASDARPFKLPTEISNVRDAHHVQISQWSQNLFTTRDEDNVVEQTSLALLQEESELSSNGDDRLDAPTA